MILRRMTQNIRNQDWFTVLVEFVMVVAGVYIGIQVSNYNDSLRDRSDERVYLNSMAQDIEVSIENLEGLIVALQAQQEARRLLYRYSKGLEADLSPPELDRLIQAALFNLQLMNISQITFNALTNSGRLSMIADANLVRELQSLDSMYSKSLRNQADDLEITYRFTDPFLVTQANMENIVLAEGISNESHLDWVEKQPGYSIPPGTLKTEAFRNLVLYRAEVTRGRLVSTSELQVQHKIVADLITQRRSQLGVAP